MSVYVQVWTQYAVWGINPEPWRTPGIPKRGYPVKDGKLQAYQDALADEIVEQNKVTMHDGFLVVEFYFWRNTQFNKPADATNCQKATEDALQGILYLNDKKNRRVTSEIIEQSTETEPLILIRVSNWEPSVIRPPERKVIGRFQDDKWKPPKEELF